MTLLLFFSVFQFCANVFGFVGQKAPAPIDNTIYGTWKINSINKTEYDAVWNFLASDVTNYKTGEKTISFEREGAVYNEFENGNLSRTGTYQEEKNKKKVLVMVAADTILYTIMAVNETELTLQSEKRNAEGFTLKKVEASR